jgi:hypothetical protein
MTYSGRPRHAHKAPSLTLTPDQIFGVGSPGVAGLRCWVRSDVVTQAGGVVSAMPGLAGTEVTLTQATSGKRPTLVASINGLNAVRFDGVDDLLDGVLLAGGSAARSFSWMVAKATSLPGGVVYAGTAYNGLGGILATCRMTATNFTALVASTDGADIVSGPPRDTNVHLFEASFETSGIARYCVDGWSYNGLFTAAPPGITGMALGAYVPSESNNGAFDIHEYGFCNFLPTTTQRSQLRDYIRSRYAIMPQGTLALDQIAPAPLCAYSLYRKWRSAASRAFAVRRADNALADVGFSSNNTNTSAIGTHCAGTTGNIRWVYDQGTRGVDVGNSTAGEQPRIYNGSSVDAESGGVTAMYYPVSAGVHALSTANAFGTAGNPGFTIAIAFDIVSGEDRLFEFGNGVAGQTLLIDAERDSTAGGREFFVGNRTGYRTFEYNGSFNVKHAVIIKIAAGSQISTWTVEENGVDLAQYTVVSGTSTLNIIAAGAHLVLGNLYNGNDSINGHISAYAIWDQLLSAPDLAVLRAEMANYL